MPKSTILKEKTSKKPKENSESVPKDQIMDQKLSKVKSQIPNADVINRYWENF